MPEKVIISGVEFLKFIFAFVKEKTILNSNI